MMSDQYTTLVPHLSTSTFNFEMDIEIVFNVIVEAFLF